MRNQTITPRKSLLLFFLFSLTSFLLSAQPSNDGCNNAIELTEVVSWCSAVGEFTTVNATESPQTSPTCFPTAQASFDVWFSFVAEATDINISVTGETNFNPGGTLRDPQLVLYSGDCNNLLEIECISDAFNVDAVQTFGGPLVIGATYYIRIGARNGQTGTFQLCINNYNEVPQPSGDCDSAVILCDKSPFTVDFVSGVGSDPDEIEGTSCNCGIAESSSTWYKWTCDQSGTLTFTITPLNPIDDIDFVFYELPNGIDDCNDKFDIRCMASGENVGEPFSVWEPCTGATGMSATDGDISESCGCQAGNNNFISAVDMEVGKSYALVINNFSNSGSGFSIEFGGTGTFVGPQANFSSVPEVVCVGEEITFSDASSYIGNIVGWQWAFGAGATLPAANSQGPHSLSYNTPGLKGILLTVEAERGCLVTKVKSVLVQCCDDHFNIDADITDLTCPGIPTGAIDFDVSSSFSPYTYNWSTGDATQDIEDLDPGQYLVTVVDASTCSTVGTYNVNSPPDFALDTSIVMPTCGGGTDGAITLSVTGATPPYEYNWDNTGFSSNNTLSGIPHGEYLVVVRDANGCETDLLIPVHELELILDPTVDAITPPSCTDFSDGSIVVLIDNGLPPFQYDWQDGNGFVNENSLLNVAEGIYEVEVQDANLCVGSFIFDMQDHPPLSGDLTPSHVSCFGENDGSIVASPGGGVGNYSFSWSNLQSSQTADMLVAGDYTVTLTDGNDCVFTITETVTQPPPLLIDVVDVLNNICFNYSDGAITVDGNGGTPPFLYSIDGQNFQDSNVFPNLPAGNFTLTVQDLNGCLESVDATVTEPGELIVEAGPDQYIDLGFQANINANVNNPQVTYSWWPPDFLDCADCEDPVASPVNTTQYTITITDDVGCFDVDSITIRVVKNRPIYTPNAFSPNNDGINDFSPFLEALLLRKY